MTGERYKVEFDDEEAKEEIRALRVSLVGLSAPLFLGPVAQDLQDKITDLLKKIYSEESIFFLQDIYKLTLMDNPRDGFLGILRNYIVPNSRFQINIDADKVEKLLSGQENETLSLHDFMSTANEICRLIDTNICNLSAEDEYSLMGLCVKQNVRGFIQELKEAKAAVQISAKRNLPLQASIVSLNETISQLQKLKINDSKYLGKYLEIIIQYTQKQNECSSALEGKREKNLVDYARDLGGKEMKLLHVKIVNEKAKNPFLPIIQQAIKKEEHKNDDNRDRVFYNPEKARIADTRSVVPRVGSGPTQAGVRLPPLRRTK